jgi:hypothetical protein
MSQLPCPSSIHNSSIPTPSQLLSASTLLTVKHPAPDFEYVDWSVNRDNLIFLGRTVSELLTNPHAENYSISCDRSTTDSQWEFEKQGQDARVGPMGVPLWCRIFFSSLAASPVMRPPPPPAAHVRESTREGVPVACVCSPQARIPEEEGGGWGKKEGEKVVSFKRQGELQSAAKC